MMKPSDKSLLSFTRQNPLKILLKLKKNDIPDRSRATTFRLGELDDFDFNKNRSFHRNESPTEVKFFLNEPSEDCISEYTWEDVLNGVNDAVVYKHLKKCGPVMQKIIVMLKNKYCVWEIAEDLHMTNNAVYKRIEKFSKKCKKRG